MATRLGSVINTKGTHEVGHMMTMFKHRETLPFGAVLTVADQDNYLPVYLDGYNADGEEICKPVDSLTIGGMYLITSPEARHYQNVASETLGDFFNEVGEKITLDMMKVGTTTFQSTAFSYHASVTVAVKGNVAYYDFATKKYIVSTLGGAPTAYTNSGTQFEVVYGEADVEPLDGRGTIGLKVIKN